MSIMDKRESLVDCVSKTIKGVYNYCTGELIIISYTDGTFSALGADKDYDDCAEIIEAKDVSFYCLGQAGIISEAEVTKLEELERADYKKQWRESRREQFELLKREFGDD